MADNAKMADKGVMDKSVDKHAKYAKMKVLLRTQTMSIACYNIKNIGIILLLSLIFSGLTAIYPAYSIEIKPLKLESLPTEEQKESTEGTQSPPSMTPKEKLEAAITEVTGVPTGESGKKEPEQVFILKKADISRIGAKASYEDFAGLRFAKYFTVAQRVEIYQEARPIDSYILDAKAIRYLGTGGRVNKWDTPVQFRSQITPLFTRAYGTQFTMDNPDDPSGQVAQIRYTLDYRELYRQYYPKWPHLLWSHWMQNEVFLIHGMQIPGINWYYTVNLGYRFSNIVEKNADLTPTNAGYENRHTYMANLAIAPNQQFEWFGQFEYFKSRRPHSTFVYSPDHWYYRTEFRFKSRDLKTSVIPSFSYSIDYYWPFKNTFEKYEISVRMGHDFNNRLSATSQIDYVLSLRKEPDNTAPNYIAPNVISDSAAYVGTENRVSYNFWDKFYLQGGLDFAAGCNMSDFDNWGTFLGAEYYWPGVLRANFGWHTNQYYNINDSLNSVEFRVYVFM